MMAAIPAMMATIVTTGSWGSAGGATGTGVAVVTTAAVVGTLAAGVGVSKE